MTRRRQARSLLVAGVAIVAASLTVALTAPDTGHRVLTVDMCPPSCTVTGAR